MERILGVCLLLMAVAATSAHAAPIELTACGAVIPPHEKGVLQNDVTCGFHCSLKPSLVCSGEDDDVCVGHGACEPDLFVLGRGATLDLNGHTIGFAYQAAGAVCGTSRDDDQGRCTVKGPGTIQGGKGTGIASHGMDVVVKSLTISFTDAAIYTPGRVIADRLEIPFDRENSVYAGHDVILRNSHIDGESLSRSGHDLSVDHVVLGPHGGGLAATGKVHGHDLTIEGFGTVTGHNVALRRVTSTGNMNGDVGSTVSATRRLHLVDSDVVTIGSGIEPMLVRSTCATSTVTGSSGSWGVCSKD